MRTVKEIEVVTCNSCGLDIVPTACHSVTIDNRQWDVCSLCCPKLAATLNFLTSAVGLPIQFSLEAPDDAS